MSPITDTQYFVGMGGWFSALLGSMVEGGLVVIHHRKSDSRTKYPMLTPWGSDVLGRWNEIREAILG